jgi:thymidylate synthase
MRVYSADDFSTVYESSLRDLYFSPEYESSPRGLKIKENLGVTLEILNPLSCLYDNQRRGSQLRYISAEFLWYFLGRNDVEFIKKYASFWETIQNEDGTVNSSYGNLLFKKKNRFAKTQYGWALDCLKKDPDSRQAIMHFNLPEHQYDGNKDFVCTLYGIWQIRENRLNLTIHMRSNDAILGTPTDIAFFTVLQQQMLSHLKSTYPNLELGKYTHIIDSYHVYDRNFKLVEEMLEVPFTAIHIPELKEDLIRTSCNPSNNLKLLSEYIGDFSTRDSLLNWINQNIIK